LLSTTSVDIAKNGGVGTATITSEDPKPKLRLRDAQVTEGSGSMVFDVDLDRPDSATVSVDYATVDDTSSPDAAGSQDYVAKSGTLTFPANTNASQHVEVPIKDDNIYEGDEDFLVQLSNNFNATIARETATGTIVDDEVKPVLAMSSTGFSVDEGDKDNIVGVDVTLSGLTDKDVTFSYSTADGTTPAAHGQGNQKDYTAVASGTGTIRAGTTLGFVPVTINGDTNKESDENFFVTISDQSQNARLGGATTQITLRNDDK
jgi:Calx-beta domain